MLISFISRERLIHSIKTAIACSLAYLIAQIIGQPADQWIVISVIVVMCGQIFVGGMFQKSYLRLLGTLMGCLMATATILMLNQSFISTLITIAVAAFIFSYIATIQDTFSQMGTLGAVTTIIIMFGNPPSMSLAIMRFLEISVGIVIAAIVSQFIFPIHARTHLRRAQADTLQQIRDYYANVVINRFKSTNSLDSIEMDEQIVKSLLKQRQLAKEAKPELMGKRFDPDHFAHSLYCEREILRSINFMDLALSKVEKLRSIYQAEGPLTNFNQTVMDAFNVIIRYFKTNQLSDCHLHIPNTQVLTEFLQPNIDTFTPDQRIYLDGFVFSAEVLALHLEELARLQLIPVSKSPLP